LINMRKEYRGYDPNGIGKNNGNFLGLPEVDRPAVEFLAVPFAVTVSYGGGTQDGPENVLIASTQLDASLPGLERPWELGFAWKTVGGDWRGKHAEARHYAELIMEYLEAGEALSAEQLDRQKMIEELGESVRQSVAGEVTRCFDEGSFPVLVGGEHAVSLGCYDAAAKKGDFGILQLDAHMDLREAYEGFKYSHASVMYNAIKEIPRLQTLVQVGIRDWCPAEAELVERSEGRIQVWYDHEMQAQALAGEAFAKTIQPILAALPQRVWISFDIDGLDPSLCAHTGTPVPGGLSFAQALHLCLAVLDSGREIIGLDMVEVAGQPHEFEGAVAARLMYAIAANACLRKPKATS
jgi:agmatinase